MLRLFGLKYKLWSELFHGRSPFSYNFFYTFICIFLKRIYIYIKNKRIYIEKEYIYKNIYLYIYFKRNRSLLVNYVIVFFS